MSSERLATLLRDAKVETEVRAINSESVVIGRDVLELVTTAMYVDPMTVYREYIQNAADSIDEARRERILPAETGGRIDIEIDVATRSVRLRDNGTGLAARDFVQRLTALGASCKRGTSARGFRGVGRLAGLGYAQEIIFRSRASGERCVSELRWDCKKLKSYLRSPDDKRDLAALITEIVSWGESPAGDYPAHFFEVELRGVVRLRSDNLLNASAIAEYLSQVAPVPFAPEFRFGAEIASRLREHVNLDGLEIRVSGIDPPVYRPHGNALGVEGKHQSVFESVSFFEIPAVDGEPAAVGWVLHHGYEGAIPNDALIKGLRLRSGNIQVGDHALLEELFPEARFNSWAVGEVHVLDPRVVTNGRRDNFEQNAHFHNLLNHLSPVARDIARRCRMSSVLRNRLREFELQATNVRETLDIVEQAGVGDAERERLALSAELGLLRMDKIAGTELPMADGPAAVQATITYLRDKLARLMDDAVADTSPLARLPEAQRKMYRHFFDLIYQCSTNRVAAKSLVDRILLKLC